MNAKKLCTRAFTMLLVMLMVIGMIPMSVLAVTKDDTLSASLDEAKSFIDGITINNSSNDPSTVVSTFKKHFTWDNEDRENGKDYLFDWSYYNGVVFEGIEYLYEVTGDEKYKDYVVEYMSSLIKADGTWAYCTNSGYTSKQCAGYNSTHGADCYKTASLLLDAYEMTGDQRYLTMAATLYTDLDSAAKTYSLKNAGNNYRHTWASDPTPDLWLDGLYMILPFRAEYAKYIGDTEELDLIVSRMQWVSDNMYNKDKGLFYHAADSATSNSGSYWLRAIGWYAAAIVDIMDSMEGDNFKAMQAQLVKLVDGMIACQNTSNGMWLNNMAASKSSTNPYETSGTALVCYAIMKAVNNGWLDESYAQYAILAFNGICNEKLDGSTLTDICFKGAPNSGNSTFYDNEGKGVGPFIMFYAEVLEYYNASRRVVYEDDYVQITATGVGLAAIDAKDVADDVENKIADVIDTEEFYVAYDVELTAYSNFETVTYTMDIMDGMSTTDLVLYHLADDGTLTPMNALMTAETDDTLAYLTFTTNTDGIFVYGTKKVVVEEDATLESLDITSQPEVNAYFKTEEDDEPALDITGLVVKATFSDGQTKTIEWNEFGEVEDGYALTFDMTKVGEQDVTVSYTYEGVTKSATFKITVFDTEITDKATKVTVAPSVPGVTEVTVEDNSEEEFVKNALRGKVTTFVSYDIELDGYKQGDSVLVTLPIPEGTVNPVVYYVPDDGSAAQKLDAYIYDDVVVFVTDHFSTYVVGDDIGVLATGDSVVGTGNIAGGKVYTLDTNGVTENKNYLIVNTNSGTGYALTNNGTNTAGSTAVTISGSTITVDDDTNIAWQFSDTTYGSNVKNGTRYIYLGNGSVISTSTRTIEVESEGNGAYQLKRYGSDYRLRYNNGSWTRANGEYTVYLYELTGTSKGAEVKFTLTTGGSNLIAVGEKLNLTGTVTVDGETVASNKYTINWASANMTTATVANGTVSGLVDGTVNITATLSAVDGKTLQNPIVITIPVTVASKKLDADVPLTLVGSPVTVVCGAAPDYSKVELVGKYEDGTEARIPYTALEFSSVDTALPGAKFATVTYGGQTFTVQVNCVNDYSGLDKAESIPEYPADGAVRIDKTSTERNFETTGIVEVELDVAGISVDTGVDVILIMDISNSMSWDDTKYDYNDTAVTAGSNQRLNIARNSAKEFVKELLGDNTGNAVADNSITVLAFAGIDGDYNDHSTANQNDDVYQLGTTAMTTTTAANTALDGLVKATTGGTNYDYAFQQAYALAGQIYEKNHRDVYIVFMTDGAPTHYNGVYYKSRDNTDLTAMMNYVDPTTGAVSRYTSTGNDRNGNDIDSTATTDITVYYNDDTTATKRVTYNKGWSDYVINNKNGWAEKVKGLDYVKHVYCIGFGMKNGSVTQGATSSMPTLNNVNGGTYYIPSSTTHAVLQHIATVPESHFEADDEVSLKAMYKNLATAIKLAGTAAQVNDVIGSKFTLQTSMTAGSIEGKQVNLADHDIKPTISVKAYDLYPKGTKLTVDGVEMDMTGDRVKNEDGSYSVSVIEEITFNEDGTEAYSSEIGEGVNIMTVANGVTTIAAKYFTYTKHADGVEEFDWYIGNITDKEIAFAFFAYLKGSLEGEAPKTAYYTNEEATLEYIDINGDYATQTFLNPVVAWGGASTAYEFYLVNEDGKPCDRQGNEIPFANRIILAGPYYAELYLNQEGETVSEVVAGDVVLPDGYELYDPTASYEVQTASGENEWGRLDVSEPADGKVQTTIVVSYTEKTYIQSRVAFGVVGYPDEAEFALEPDMVVIDYGKPIVVDPSVNNTEAKEEAADHTIELVGFTTYYPDLDLNQQFNTTTSKPTFNGKYGVFTITADKKAQYTPYSLVNSVDSVFCVYKFTEGEEEFFMADALHVIPATFVYYETNFLATNFAEDTGLTLPEGAGVFTTKGAWSKAKLAENDIVADGPQNYWPVGDVNDRYGFDTTYQNDKGLSNGSSYFVNGTGLDSTNVEFTFTGTGFDLISRTGDKQGIIRADIYTADGELYKKVSVLNKSESTLELFQIPVISVNDLPYGTYKVIIGADKGYENKNYPQLTRGDEFYFDAIRIYGPVDVTSRTPETNIALAAYNADCEANYKLHEVRALLLDAGSFDEATGDKTGIVFVDRTYEADEDGNVTETGVKITDYTTIGPNNEVYLVGYQTIGFYLTFTGDLPTSVHIGAKSVDGNAATLNVAASYADGTEISAVDQNIASNTSLYYDVLNGAKLTGNKIYVTVFNTGKGILSITDIKVGYGDGTTGAAVIGVDDVAGYKAVKSVEKRIGVEEEAKNYDVISAEFTEESIKRRTEATLIVTTPESVESLVILNSSDREEKFTAEYEVVNGVKVWTVKMTIIAVGTRTYTITGYSTDGLAGASVEATIKVTIF